jgi:mannose-1-phosphate guanylyltransferase
MMEKPSHSHAFPPPSAGRDASDLLTPSAAAVVDDAADAVGTLTAEQPEAEDALATDAALWAVVLAGGIGSRFWPLSTPQRPKQLLALVGDRPLIADTVGRLGPLIPAERVLVVTSRDIADALHAAIPEIPHANMLIEPRPLGTAAALAWGAQEVARRAGPKTVFCALHADLAAGYPDEFRRALRRAAGIAASDDCLVALAARPTRPETGFGYMLPGAPLEPELPLSKGGACRVRRFVEKPGPILAEELIEAGALWNTGVFVWQAGVVLDALAAHTTELAHGLSALEAGRYDRFAGMIQSISIDRGLMERSERVVALTADFGWDDVGTWACLRRVRELDDTGNGVAGAAHLVDASSNIVHAESGTVVVYGVSKMLVVTLPGLTFVTSLDRATELNPLLDVLPSELRPRPARDEAADGPQMGAD